MERLIRWFVNNTVAANMVMLFILVAGLLTLPRIRMEVFPDINVDVISISVVYPGASPKDVEESICYRIEEKLTGLKGVKRIRSTASENIGVTTVEILPGEDVNQIQDKIKTQIDAIDTFPDNAEKPTIQNMTRTSDVITVPVYGDGSNIRDWLYVDDHCRAIKTVFENGKIGETYNIGGDNEIKNIDIVKSICEILDELKPSYNGKYTNHITLVKDRPGHDFRYAINAEKIQSSLGWYPSESFNTGIKKTIDWYLKNEGWWKRIQDKKYKQDRLGENK